MLDVVIIGGGIMGVTVARMLSEYKLDAALLERDYDIGEGATKSNSGILAAGFNPRAGSLKGISCVRGNAMYRDICRQLDVPVKYIGSLLVAFDEDGVEKMMEKYRKGLGNEVPGMRILSGDEARAMEPNLSEEVIKALYAPTTGIVDIFKLVLHNARLAALNGVSFHMNTEVLGIEHQPGYYHIITSQGEFDTRFLVNTAGEHADMVESFIKPCEFVIKPRRGQFFVFEKQDPCPIRHVLYQAQVSAEKGGLLAPTINGNLIAGPTAEDAPSYDDVRTTEEGLQKIARGIRRTIPSIDLSKVITSFAGNRANIDNVVKEKKDFIIRRTAEGMVSALGIKNPGITCTPYLCQVILKKLEEDGLLLERRNDCLTELKQQKNFFDCSRAEQRALLAQDPAYGRIVCRCERITAGDIRRVLREPLPPSTLDGMKKRLRLGMGRCQGGFCTPEVLEILSEEWNVPVSRICKSGAGSELVKGRVK